MNIPDELIAEFEATLAAEEEKLLVELRSHIADYERDNPTGIQPKPPDGFSFVEIWERQFGLNRGQARDGKGRWADMGGRGTREAAQASAQRKIEALSSGKQGEVTTTERHMRFGSGLSRQQQEEIIRVRKEIDAIHGVAMDADERLYVSFTELPSTMLRGQYKTGVGVPAGNATVNKAGALGPGQSRLTLRHEIGHWIDNRGLSSRDSEEFWSETEEAEGFMRVLTTSPAVRRLQDNRAEGKNRWTNYALSKREVFARGYAQYITTKARDGTALTAIRAESIKGTQWTAEEFAPISDAFDGLFRDKGWLNE